MAHLTCDLKGCNNSFYKKPSKMKKSKSGKHFCSSQHFHKSDVRVGKKKKYVERLVLCANAEEDYCKGIVKLTKPNQTYCSQACYSKSKRNTPEQNRQRALRKDRARRNKLSITYIKRLIRDSCSLDTSEIPQELIDLKRKQIKLYRLTHEKN